MSVEWVETTGRTVEEAKEAALDQLGVDERDAEFTVVEEARSGLFGRLRQEARVRARVRPDRPQPKVDRRDRRRRESEGERSSAGRRDRSTGPPKAAPAGGGQTWPAAGEQAAATGGSGQEAEGGRSAGEQADDAEAFLSGLADAFGLDGQVEVEHVDDGMIEARLVGEGLGVLIGPKGQTLAAIQELTRAAAQRGPRGSARLRVDIGGYQQRRRTALERFTREVAEQVRNTGVVTSLEPMVAPDRKVVHDTVNTIEGVSSRSEGEDPRRRVLIVPEEPTG